MHNVCCHIARHELPDEIPARPPALRLFKLSWIHSSPDKCIASPCTSERNSILSHPSLPPPHAAPAGSPLAGFDCRRRRQLSITAAACRRRLPGRSVPKCCSLRVTHWRHPLERGSDVRLSVSAPGDARQEETHFPAGPGLSSHLAAPFNRHLFVEFLVGNLVELLVPGVLRLVVGCRDD